MGRNTNGPTTAGPDNTAGPAGPDGPEPGGPDAAGEASGAPQPTVSRRSFLAGAGAGAAAVSLVGAGPLAALLRSKARPAFTHASPPPATDRRHYKYRFVATGAPRYSLESGHLPAGLTLHPVTGVLSGTPKGRHTAVFRIRATNKAGWATTRQLEVPVRSGRPVNTVRPVLSDRIPAVGDTLRVSHGTWT